MTLTDLAHETDLTNNDPCSHVGSDVCCGQTLDALGSNPHPDKHLASESHSVAHQAPRKWTLPHQLHQSVTQNY